MNTLDSLKLTARYYTSKYSSYFDRRICIALTVVLLLCFYQYFFAVHRMKSYTELKRAISVMQLPTYNHRCRSYNTTHYRCLPNVLLIGSSKCGTTSVTDYLFTNPDIRFIKRNIIKYDHHKEVHRFDRSTYRWAFRAVEMAEEWALTPLITNISMPVIHYTPHYLYAPTVPYDIRKFYPHPEELKFIVLLREPISRALSSYWFKNSYKFHTVDQGTKCPGYCYKTKNAKQLDRDSISIKKCFDKIWGYEELGFHHVLKGIYYDQLERWFDNFPSENFHISTLESWQKNASYQYDELLKFLGTKTHSYYPNFATRKLEKPNSLATNDPISSSLFAKLRDFYNTYNLKLELMLGESVHWNVNYASR